MSIVNQTVPRALTKLGYSDDEVAAIEAYIDEHKSIVGAPALKSEHLPIFACSMGDNTIHYLGHVKMMGAVQPFISGAISKTVNMPEDATIEDVANLHMDAWKLGVKAVAIYRDNCKVGQPLSTAKKDGDESTSSVTATDSVAAELFTKIHKLEAALDLAKSEGSHVLIGAVRERMPRRRESATFSFRVADCEGYVTVGEYEDGRPGEVFIKVSKQGSTLAGIMDAFSISISLGLQHGVPLATYVRKYVNMKFEPSGMTDDADLRIVVWRSTTSTRASAKSSACSRRASASNQRCPRLSNRQPRQSTRACNPRLSTSARSRRMSRGWSTAPSSAMRPCVTSAATQCSAPVRATCVRHAARRAAAPNFKLQVNISANCVPFSVQLHQHFRGIQSLSASPSTDLATRGDPLQRCLKAKGGERAFVTRGWRWQCT
jgi:hypothetical protein